MTVRYNGSANRALFHTEKNNKARSKTLGKLASGMKINSAGDDAANFSISSRMRVKLRALEQDTQNVQNGSAILRTAEGGIQGQIDLLRTIRAKVIDAANDSNTDDDRQTIQKELYHLYTQMENLAYDTDYNSKKPLLADKVIRLNEGDLEEIRKTKLNLIPNAKYDVLDNVYGPFDTFTEYSSTTERLTLEQKQTYQQSTPDRYTIEGTIDFSSYSDASELNNVGINVNGTRYVFTDDTSKNYRYVSDSNEILLADTLDETIDNLVNKIGATRNGNVITLTTTTTSSKIVDTASDPGGRVNNSTNVSHSIKPAGISGTTTGSFNNLGDIDLGENAKATLTVSLSGAALDSGFQFDSTNFRINPTKKRW